MIEVFLEHIKSQLLSSFLFVLSVSRGSISFKLYCVFFHEIKSHLTFIIVVNDNHQFSRKFPLAELRQRHMRAITDFPLTTDMEKGTNIPSALHSLRMGALKRSRTFSLNFFYPPQYGFPEISS